MSTEMNTNKDWELDDCANGGKVVVMKDEAGKVIGRIQVYPEKTAQQIVKSVNMHNELVNALAELLRVSSHTNTFAKDIANTHAFNVLRKAEQK